MGTKVYLYLSLMICLLIRLNGFAQNNVLTFNIEPTPSTEEIIKIQSKVYSEERTIMISLPDNYVKENSRYPVIYFTDGSSSFMKLLRAMVNFWSKKGVMPEAILVGIVHKDRDYELTPKDPEQYNTLTYKAYTNNNCGGADQLIEFIDQELFSLIENNYRTVPSRIFVGWSYGGLFGLYSLLKKPDMFNGQIAVDPSYWWSKGTYADSLISYLKHYPSFEYSLFVSRRTDYYVLQYSKLQEIAKKQSNFKYNLYLLPPEETHETAFPITIYYGLAKIFDGYKLDEKNSFEEFKNHSSTPILGYTYPPTESAINSFGYKKLAKKEYDDALAAFKYNVEKFPDSANTYDSLAEVYMTIGNTQLAIENYEKSLELNPKNTNAVTQLKKLKEK